MVLCAILPYRYANYWCIGVLTAYIDAGASAAAVQAALNSLPTVAPDTVTVVTTPITNGNRYTVTFNSGMRLMT